MSWFKRKKTPQKIDFVFVNERCLTNEEEEIIARQADKLLELMESEVNRYNTLEMELVNRQNSVCPNCGDKEVVNKIQNTHGEGSYDSYSSNSYSSSSFKFNTQTDPVNHCNKCGNQWHKPKLRLREVGDSFTGYGLKCYRETLETVYAKFHNKYMPEVYWQPSIKDGIREEFL